jgi:hypothetical protein
MEDQFAPSGAILELLQLEFPIGEPAINIEHSSQQGVFDDHRCATAEAPVP